MRKHPVIHPFLLALFPILYLLENNLDKVLISQALLPAAMVLGFTTLALFLLTVIVGDVRRAGLIVSIFLVLFLSYGHVFDVIETVVGDQPGDGLGHGHVLAVCALVFVGCTLFAVKLRDETNSTRALNFVAIVLVARPLAGIGMGEVKAARINSSALETAGAHSETYAIDDESADRPDIYYIILDRYASSRTLEEHWGFDNGEFVDFLTSRGFYVAAESTANYPKTFQSLASSLNMTHLTHLTDELGEETSSRKPVYGMLEDYEVWQFLKARGYTFMHFGSSWEPTRYNKYADVNFSVYPAEFTMMLYRTTPLYPMGVELGFFDERAVQRRAILRKFDELATVPDREGPTFVFAHILLPHAPYLFGPEGVEVTSEQEEARTEAENYLNQLIFTNEVVMELVDEILSASESPPIIILQADEGPFIPFLDEFGGDGTDWRPLSDAAVRTHMRILNAYHLPDADPAEMLYPSITPVNTFRILFDHYFGADYGLLPDESYMVEDTLHPYKFMDVTDRVAYD
ncbi:MAG: hypothetical protein ACOC8C_00640 [Chloroflexota bacterium]